MLSDKTDIKELSKEELVNWLSKRKIEAYRANQILRWIYKRQADRFDQMTNLNKAIREKLDQHFQIRRLGKKTVEYSRDGSRKYLFRLPDNLCIESVLIPEKQHYTLCLSSQVGCAQGCRFCLTGKYGFFRNLTKNEIVSQVRDIIKDIDDTSCLTNIVLMGMGEPLANYKNVLSAIGVITDSKTGLNFSGRRITLSTVGLTHQFMRLGHDTDVNLAVSLNATDNRTRNRLMPVNRRHPIEKLLEACKDYPLKPRRKITIEYVLLKGVNDSPDDAHRLVRLLRPIKAKINLIPFNPHGGSEFSRPDDTTIDRFQNILIKHNYTVMIRHSKGQDISAACGQLGTQYVDKSKAS
ncbi:23S rRNA (adenine(2503)-C(2))-methyltransferase RlmN [Thermodesulfobacteriota bacterium]